jgi:hypothetical protein
MWPSDKTVARAFKGQIAEVIMTPLGPGKGVRSSEPWIYLIVGPKSFVYCEECKVSEWAPAPPGSGAPGEPPISLVAPGTKPHALFILTWLHRFSQNHKHHQDDEVSLTGELPVADSVSSDQEGK